MRFAITEHSRSGAPADALELLWKRLDGRRFEDVSFKRSGSDVIARIDNDAPIGREGDERHEADRLAVLACLHEVCERAPELNGAWFAVTRSR